MRKTRWSERDVSYEHLYLDLLFIVEELQIINGTLPSINTFMKSLPEDGARIQRKEQRLISMPLQALSS